jgi:hypothetical protein
LCRFWLIKIKKRTLFAGVEWGSEQAKKEIVEISSANMDCWPPHCELDNRQNAKVFAFSKVAATEENQGFLHSFPFLTIAYTSRPVFFGHVLAIWALRLFFLVLSFCAGDMGKQDLSISKCLFC